jgi:two-component system chemotaxis response regulator CheY
VIDMAKVLIVDDAAFMRMAIRRILESNGFEIVGEAGNGSEGVEKYLLYKPDIVTMDITMPEMGGIEAVKVIRQHDPKAKIIMISAMGQECMVKDAIINGAKSFIVKPFKEEHVLQAFSKVLAV